jgi:four helix bundle protein
LFGLFFLSSVMIVFMMPYERFQAWKLSYRLTLEVYRVTTSFPKYELYGLTSQSRRAAFSVVANIAEGSAKRGPAEFRRFLDIALGSLSELSVTLRLARDLNLLSAEAWQEIERLRNHAGTLVWRLYNAVGKGKRQVAWQPTARYRPVPPSTA